MRLNAVVRRGLFALLTSALLAACYHAPVYCHRTWVAPRYGYAGYWHCV
jgi:hypothetical protein